ncbi:reductase [Actinoplanes italicus]|uniref:NAD(P)H-dependent FMN reductase n=1 Tax=Actinoplanes italicus TaxID=113567 RepID=A0A2T0KFV4_9ACTN|nr:NAD(P)H-dependent oxidoreductase [Actinoplanes italicus]PRX22255.1 NAD(P)H-dependent FMN reductase [Actinoplanes italicus]GIE29324.1 reductase [Actinoplanes italicus]
MPKLMVIIGSTRPGRAGLPIGDWFADRARAHGDFDVDVADLAEIGLPLLDEPHHPRLRQYVHQHTREWSARVESADAFVIVTPEYNYGYPAAVKNALDHLAREWAYAPVGFVSYGGIAAGTRAVQQLKQVVTTLRMIPVFESVNIPFHAQHIADGTFTPPPGTDDAAKAMLGELAKVEAGSRSLRADTRITLT